MFSEIDKIGVDGARTVLTMSPAEEYVVGRGETLNVIYFDADAGAKCADFNNRATGGAAGGKRSCRIVLKGPGARALFLGFVVGKADRRFLVETTAAHVKGGATSEVRMKAVLFDHSRLDFRGDLVIERDAQLSDTFLACHSLLLGDGAAAHAIPSLEIMADDVKAGHAATAGRVNEDDLFYLESRGISRPEAEQLLVLGFFEEQLLRIPDIDLRDSLRQAIIKSLPF